MDYKLRKLLDLVRNNKSLREISKEMRLSPAKINNLLNLLKRYGIILQTNYYYNADIRYQELQRKSNKNIELLLENKTDITIIAISDQHYGNIKEDSEALNRLYEYCVNNNIHIILNGGDLIDGIYTNIPIDDQIAYAIEKYPYDSSIINFICYGNHDYFIGEETSNYLERIIKQNRPDIISLGYGMGLLKIKNDNICLSHKITGKENIIIPSINGLHLFGHSHHFKLMPSDSRLGIYLPTLSYMTTANNNIKPSASAIKLHIVLNENTGIMEEITVDHLIVSDKISSAFSETFTIKNQQKEKTRKMANLTQSTKYYYHCSMR
ncbi:MAG: metallophosphoesterase [Bacilli bacterium]|nr:metallophosphoesterase [Bacilli bacterium]